jgi:hypothetical protein
MIGGSSMFDLVTSHDFYAMLVADFDDYMAEPYSARRFVHCAITASHLAEWVWHDQIAGNPELQAKLGVKTFKEFLTWVNRRSLWYGMIRELANGTKHFRYKQSFETVRVMAAPPALSQEITIADKGRWDGPIRYVQSSIPVEADGKGYLLIDFGDDEEEDRSMPAAHVLEVVVRLWRDFFRIYCPVPVIPASKHHVD